MSILFHSNNSSPSLLGLLSSMFLSNFLACYTPSFVIQLSKLPQRPQKYKRSSLPVISTDWSINPLVYYPCFHAKPYVLWIGKEYLHHLDSSSPQLEFGCLFLLNANPLLPSRSIYFFFKNINNMLHYHKKLVISFCIMLAI